MAELELIVNQLREQQRALTEELAAHDSMVAALAVVNRMLDAYGVDATKKSPKRGPDKVPRKRAALGKGMPETPTPAPEQTISTGVAGATDLGDKDVAKAMSATWCRRSSADLNDKTCARMQREGGHLCTAGCARKTKSTG